MKTYLVTWEINIEADSARDAAEAALKIQREPDGIATVFDVFHPSEEPVRIDLSERGTRDLNQ